MQYGNNKWGKYRALRRDAALARHLPLTRMATNENIRRMLTKNDSVYLKPSHGTGGFGILKLSRRAGGGYDLQYGTKRRSFATLDRAYRAFLQAKQNKRYLVQTGISMLRHLGRPFDLRIMVQRDRASRWEVTGIVGRVAKPRMVVTNYHSGGKPMPVPDLLGPLMSKADQASYVDRLKRLSIRTSAHMSRYFPAYRAFGIDVAVDRKRKPWILEVNSRPDKYIFRALPDKTMFHRIMRYAKPPGKKQR
ncbi:YheC/YheD family protein [Cohnella nanjingensis]|uniref:YheC/YheD family protein n=1 Tax=Cohnella nanjingensis TaxID=1387779 RepID=A0A7X0VFT6_9BACL|nr:YheC/YheD family protein [Cohnella nanjingensis]MBB6672400.1 YheC/YheD family protein [Cohnella nanjingensis]